MTVSSTTSRNEYNGNGSTDTFAYTFRILDQDHIAVYVDDVLQTITTGYTVTDVGVSGGGDIIFTTAPATGTANVIFLRAVPLTQETDYVENDPFPAESHEDALDKLTMIVQQQQEQLDRTIVLPPTSTVSDLTLPIPSAGKALLWNATEDALENSTDDFNLIVTSATTQANAAAVSASTAATQAGIATTEAGLAEAARLAAEAAAATIPAYGPLTGEALNYVRLNAAEDTMEFRTPAEVLSDIGAEPADAQIAKTDVAQTFTLPQRGTVTTDNDLSFDLSATNNFTCTPTAGGTLTFTNIAAGQSGFIKLVNGSNYAITAAATTKVTTTFLATISATGTYIISYFSDGTNVYCATAGSMA
jgi:hypothetical protein